MDGLDIRVLGAPDISVDGTPLVVDTRKAVALLAYLAVTASTPRREEICALLWPDHAEARAKAALRRTLSVLRAALGDRWMDAGRAQISLRGHRCDFTDFRAASRGCDQHSGSPAASCGACIESLRTAASLVRGDFLAGFGLRDSTTFDDWQLAIATETRRELAMVLRVLSVAAGESEDAIALVRRWLALDELDESAHARLMLLYAATGQRQAALRQYQSLTAILRNELGVDPLPSSTEAYEAILSGHDAGPRSVAVTVSSPKERLVGRGVEFEAVLAGVRSSDAGPVLVMGEAGVGKTRLVDEVLTRIRSEGLRTIGVRCFRAESPVAYAPVIDALRAAGATSALPEALVEASRLVPELRPPGMDEPAPLDSAGSRHRFFESVADVLSASIDRGVLFVDDLQWADDATLDLVGYLVRRPQGRRMSIVGAYRSDEPDDRLDEIASRATRVELHRLSASEVAELASSVRPELSDADTERLYRESEGLPLFCTEYLAGLSTEVDWTMPPGVRELMRSRLASVDTLSRQVLTAVAVIGRSAEPDLIRAVSGRSDEETIAALDDLVSRRLLTDSGGGYEFAHDKLREVAYADCGLARRRLLHRRAARALSKRGKPQPAVVASHLREAGDDDAAASVFLDAAHGSVALGANAEALAHFSAALALGHPDAASIHGSIGDVQTRLADYEAALSAYRTAAAMAPGDSTASLEHRMGIVLARAGRLEAADAHYTAALESIPDGAGRARVIADRSLLAHQRGDATAARTFATEALEAATGAGDPSALAQAHNILGVLSTASGDAASARSHLERSLGFAESIPDRTAAVAARNNLALALAAGGDLDAAISHERTALAACEMLGDVHREAAIHNNLADLLHAAGDMDASREHQLRAVALFAEVGEKAGGTSPEIWNLVEW